MKIYVDESGTFSVDKKGQPHSISCVGALVIPEMIENELFKTFEGWKISISSKYNLKNSEIKGSMLNEDDFKSLLKDLSYFDIVMEVAAVDLSHTNIVEIEKHKSIMSITHANSTTGRAANSQFGRDVFTSLSLPNYVQTLSTNSLLYNILEIAINYYAQRSPQTLGNFQWIFDAKDAREITNYEKILVYVLKPLLQTSCYNKPLSSLEGANYSYMSKYIIDKKYIFRLDYHKK